MSLPVPESLTSNREFMFIYRLALLGTTDKQREDVDALLALAFKAGECSGVQQAIDAHSKVLT